MITFYADFFDVVIDYPEIYLAHADGRKIVCTEVSEFEDTFIKLVDCFELNREYVLRTACQKGWLEVARYFMDDVENGSYLKDAARHGNLEIVKLLVENGADINTGKGSAYRYSANNSYHEVARYLLESGLDVSQIDPDSVVTRSGKNMLEEFR